MTSTATPSDFGLSSEPAERRRLAPLQNPDERELREPDANSTLNVGGERSPDARSCWAVREATTRRAWSLRGRTEKTRERGRVGRKMGELRLRGDE